MIALLESIFQGEKAVYGEALAIRRATDADRPRLADLLADPARLDDILVRQARYFGTRDLRPVASAWSLTYFSALLPPVVAAASMLRHVFPVSARDVSLALDERGAPVAFFIPHEGRRFNESDTTTRYATLLWDHLLPLIEGLASRARLSPKVFWANAARHLDAILQQALHLNGQAPGIAGDQEQLLDRPTWPDGRRNPLFRRRHEISRTEGDERAPVRLHRACCLNYLLPTEGGYCSACPLAPGNRPARKRPSRFEHDAPRS